MSKSRYYRFRPGKKSEHEEEQNRLLSIMLYKQCTAEKARREIQNITLSFAAHHMDGFPDSGGVTAGTVSATVKTKVNVTPIQNNYLAEEEFIHEFLQASRNMGRGLR